LQTKTGGYLFFVPSRYRVVALLAYCLWVVVATPAVAEEPLNPADDQLPVIPAPAVEPARPIHNNWLDKSQRYVSESGDSLATWMDSFFGETDSDIESASSILRLAAIYDFDEVKDDELDAKIQGKLQLPALSRRFSLVFSDEDGDVNDPLDEPQDGESNSQVALVYLLKDKDRHRVDLFGGVRSGLKSRAGVRYRYQYSPTRKYYHRFTEQLAYDQDDHTITVTRLDFSYLLDSNAILRLKNRVRYGEETDGAEWKSQLSRQSRISDTKAITYFVVINGITDPDKLIKSYGPGIRYRQNIFRDYLFLDLVPAYGWRKTSADVNREGAWSFEIQLEMFFQKKNKKKH